MIRDKLDLNGYWQFKINPGEEDIIAEPRDLLPIKVPGCWQAQFPALRTYRGLALYRRVFRLPRGWKHERYMGILLRFGAVSDHCEVWLNGRHIGWHDGGFTPFRFQSQDLLYYDGRENDLRLLVTGAVAPPPPPPLTYTAMHGSAGWTVPSDGVWQEVWLERVDLPYFQYLHVTPDIERNAITIEAKLAGFPANWSSGNGQMRFQVHTAEGHRFTTETSFSTDRDTYNVEIILPGAGRWSPETPILHTAQVDWRDSRDVRDRLSVSFGLRKIEARSGRIYLNGNPIYLCGVIDQDFYPDTVYTPPSRDLLESQFRRAKALGLNLLRLHTRLPHPRYLEIADQMGLLVWAELPLRNAPLSDKARRAAIYLLDELLARDYNHPSLVVWSLAREPWQQAFVDTAEGRTWLKEAAARIKIADPVRLLVDTNPASEEISDESTTATFHVQTDLVTAGAYYAFPDRVEALYSWAAEFAERPSNLYSPYGDAVKTGREPLVVAELGHWSLPSRHHLHMYYGTEPWWSVVPSVEPTPEATVRDLENELLLPDGSSIFSVDLSQVSLEEGDSEENETYQEEEVGPAGVEARFDAWNLATVFHDFAGLATATQRHQLAALREMILTIRQYSTVAGHVLNQLSDMPREATGLLDVFRMPKEPLISLASLHAADLLICAERRHNFWAGDFFTANILLSDTCGVHHEEAQFNWSVSNTDLRGEEGNVAVRSFAVARVGLVEFLVPEVPLMKKCILSYTLTTAFGQKIAEGTHEIHFYPREKRMFFDRQRLGLYDPRNRYRLNEQLDFMGYELITQLDYSIDCAIVTEINHEVEQYINRGGTVLFLARGMNPFIPLADRAETVWRGDWPSSFIWMRPDLFVDLPLENPLGWPFASIVPEKVIVGWTPEYASDVLAGIFVGWLQNPAVVLAQFRHGRGRVVVTTFQLEAAAGTDPATTILLHSLIAYLHSPKCAPQREIAFARSRRLRET